MVKTPSGDIVDVTVSGLTPLGMVTRRRNLSINTSNKNVNSLYTWLKANEEKSEITRD